MVVQIKARIEEFDQFYDENYSDYRIAYFEKQKLRLRKVLTSYLDIEELQEQERFSQRQVKRQSRKKASPPRRKQSKQGQSFLVFSTSYFPEAPSRQQDSRRTKPKPARRQSPGRQGSGRKPKKKKVKKGGDDDEIVFSIKMSKEEYKQYIAAKAKMKGY